MVPSQKSGVQVLAPQVLHDDAGIILDLYPIPVDNVGMAGSEQYLPLLHHRLEGREVDAVLGTEITSAMADVAGDMMPPRGSGRVEIIPTPPSTISVAMTSGSRMIRSVVSTVTMLPLTVGMLKAAVSCQEHLQTEKTQGELA